MNPKVQIQESIKYFLPKTMLNYILMKLSFLPLFFYCTMVTAQFLHPRLPFEKIQYAGLNPLWHEASYDAAMNGDSLDGYNQFSPSFEVDEIYHNDLVFTPYVCRSPYAWAGGYIECRSVSDGQLKWQQRFNLDNNDHVEIIAMLYVDEDNHLVVLSHKERKPYERADVQFYFKNMILTRRVYNIATGELLSYFHRGYTDSLAYPTATSFFAKSGSSKFFRENNAFRYIEKFGVGGVRYLKSCLLDDTGALLSTVDTMAVPYYNLSFNLEQISVDTLLEIELDRNKHLIYFRYLKPNLDLYYEVVSDSLEIDPTFIKLEKKSSDNSKFLFSNYFKIEGIPNDHSEFLSFDRHANLLKSGRLAFTSPGWHHPLEWEDRSDQFTMLSREYVEINDSLQSTLQVFKLGPNYNREKINTFISTNILRYINVRSSKKVDVDKYYLRFRESAFYGNQVLFSDIHAVAQSQMLVDSDNLLLPISSTTLNQGSDIAMNLYPNPTYDECTIEFDKPFNGRISVISPLGVIVLNQKMDNEYSYHIDLSHQPAGIYAIIINNLDGSVSVVKKVVKMTR